MRKLIFPDEYEDTREHPEYEDTRTGDTKIEETPTEETPIEETQTEETTIMESTNKSIFKPPKSRIFTGKGEDQDAARVDTWIQEMKDFLDLSGIKNEQLKIITAQYFLSDTAVTAQREAGFKV